MNYQKCLNIGGHYINVELVDGWSTNTNTKCFADMSLQDGKIRIATRTTDGDRVSLSELSERLVHEILEAINEVYVVGLGTERDKEDHVESLAQGLLQVFDDLSIQLIKE